MKHILFYIFALSVSIGFSQTSALLKINPNQEHEIQSLGIAYKKYGENWLSVTATPEKLLQLKTHPAVKQFISSTVWYPKLKASKTEALVEAAQNLGYTGQGVVIGIIDQGFDYLHPAWNQRLKRVWNQNAWQGTPPVGFTYGVELLPAVFSIELQDGQANSHGTQMASIIAGNANPNQVFTNQMNGIAPAADLVFVSTDGQSAHIIDGIAYVFEYASSVGKPAVVNVSFGSHLGPHDGSSLEDAILNQLLTSTGGRILVTSAGNEGDIPLHLTYTFQSDSLRSIVTFDNPQGNGWLDGWAPSGSIFDAAISVIDASGNLLQSTDWFSVTDTSRMDTLLVNGHEIYINWWGNDSAGVNLQSNIRIEIQNAGTNLILLRAKGVSGKVDWYNAGTSKGAPFSDEGPNGVIPGLVSGTVSGTISEPGNHPLAITVGTYAVESRFQNLAGDSVNSTYATPNGMRSQFSSQGPTRDNRVKPDISAPGEILSASWTRTESPVSTDRIAWILDGTDTIYYGACAGSSYASAFVSGVVALMLEAFPGLGAEMAQSIIQNSARQDQFTGVISGLGDNLWGFGKINALQAVQTALLASNRKNSTFINTVELFPNPVTTHFYCKGLNQEPFEIQTMLGVSVHKGELSEEWTPISLEYLPSGIYLFKTRSKAIRIIKM
ncbi:MAG: S8 family serine peptidase [Bacteroidia bacterium]|nr:S8 family serine peptidase [Bacteroidia bacterium]